MVGYKFNSFVAYPKTPKLCLQKNLRKFICNLGDYLVIYKYTCGRGEIGRRTRFRF